MEEFECTVCMRLLLQPVTISCGHTFCKSCLFKALKMQPQCPQCREPCLTQPNRLPINIMIQNHIEKNYKEQLQTRKNEDEEDENQQLKYNPDKLKLGQQLPLFLLQNFLYGPSEVVKFRIFEPRYIQMVETIQTGEKMFAICDINTQFTVAAALKQVQRLNINNPNYRMVYEIIAVICCPLKTTKVLDAQMQPVEFQNKQVRENIIKDTNNLYTAEFEIIKDEDEVDQEMKNLQNEIKNFVIMHIQRISNSDKFYLAQSYDQTQLQSLQEFS